MGVALTKTVPDAALKTAVARLHAVGVFADEDNQLQFPSPIMPGPRLRGLQDLIRSAGYRGGDLDIVTVEEEDNDGLTVLFDRDRHLTAEAAVGAWHTDHANRWRQYVETRVKDWLDRLEALKDTMAAWLPSDLSIKDLPPTPLHETLMRRYSVPRADMPTFEIWNGSQAVMRVEPRGLWVVGANGRVDLTTRQSAYILVDISEPLSGPAEWKVYDLSKHLKSETLDAAFFLGMLGR